MNNTIWEPKSEKVVVLFMIYFTVFRIIFESDVHRCANGFEICFSINVQCSMFNAKGFAEQENKSSAKPKARQSGRNIPTREQEAAVSR